MLIRSEFEIQFELAAPVAMMAMLHAHPTLDEKLRGEDRLTVEHMEGGVAKPVHAVAFEDCFGNRCERFLAPQGRLRLTGGHVSEMGEMPDEFDWNAVQHAPQDLPSNTLQFLLSSRYCPVDQMTHAATDLFNTYGTGWALAAGIRDWVHNHVRFDYASARPTKTALDAFTERVGVCRDFQHLAITLTRAMNIPARYATGYLGDIRIPYSGPGDFSAWYEVYLGGRWWTMDARHNNPRLGRVLMATGRDATDVALTTSFGAAELKHFYVDSFEVNADGSKVPIAGEPAGSSADGGLRATRADAPSALNASSRAA